MKIKSEFDNKTKKIFVDAYCLLKREHNTNIRVQDLARKAGYNRCTFYQHFKDIQELQEYMEDLLVNKLKSIIAQNLENKDIFENFISYFKQLFDENQLYVETLFVNTQLYFTKRLKQELKPLLIAAHKISKESKRQDYILEYYIHATISTIALWINNQRDICQEELGILLKDLLQTGVYTQLIKTTTAK